MRFIVDSQDTLAHQFSPSFPVCDPTTGMLTVKVVPLVWSG
jgi:hypothetical protein